MLITVKVIGPMVCWYVDDELQTMYRRGTLYMYQAYDQIHQNYPFARFANYPIARFA
jgi:hypothetical protein